MKTFLEKLNSTPIDWCFNCAMTAYKKHQSKKLMFTYILIQYIRSSPMGFRRFAETENGFKFILDRDFFEEWDNISINSLKYKKRYYKGLIPILEAHLKNCDDTKIRKFTLRFLDRNLLVLFE